jgi:hypothetical protein
MKREHASSRWSPPLGQRLPAREGNRLFGPAALILAHRNAREMLTKVYFADERLELVHVCLSPCMIFGRVAEPGKVVRQALDLIRRRWMRSEAGVAF